MTFEQHVERALATVPPQVATALQNLAVLVEDENRQEPDLLGLFEEHEYLPARITIYRLPLVESFPDPVELEEQIRITVLHELAHYFGIEEDRLEELGYG